MIGRTLGHYQILDFGLAKAQDPGGGRVFPSTALRAGRPGETAGPEGPASTDLPTMMPPVVTATGTVLGTVGYMSPEQVRAQTVDRRSDIFSFGCVLYEMVSGRRAFVREQRDGDIWLATLKQ
jgi:serine/threonine protein kinase